VNPATDLEEQVVALKFLLHFVGDLHQPLQDSDDHDRGGNDKRVSAAGFKAGNLHHYWDTEFVDQLGPDAKAIASDLIGHITKDQVTQWQAGDVPAWAQEPSGLQRATRTVNCGTQRTWQFSSFGQLRERGRSAQDVSLQLSKAGVRLTSILNQALRKP
jgi:nuclease S1